MNIVPGTKRNVIKTPLELDVSAPSAPAAQAFNDAHPIEHRVANWKAQEEAFKMQLLHRTQGAAEPIRRQMELQIVEQSTFVPSVVGGPANVHLDVLRNTDASIDWEDVYHDEPRFDFQHELQKRMC